MVALNTLPTWEAAETAVNRGNPTPLDTFIYEHEPQGDTDELQFRSQLCLAINYSLINDDRE